LRAYASTYAWRQASITFVFNTQQILFARQERMARALQHKNQQAHAIFDFRGCVSLETLHGV
jgi:hypothetical protein